jgi:hypothetical protein
MKRLFLPIFVFLLLAGGWGLLGAFELEVVGGVDGLTFQPDKTSAYTEPDTDKQFKPYPFGLINITFRHNFSETLNFCVNFEKDNILQNSINAVFGVKTDYFSVKFGPFLGLIDNFNVPDAGITGNMEVTIPGIIFLSIGGSSTLGSKYEYTGDNYRETAGIKLGFWLENAIPSFSVNIKSFSRQIEESLAVEDTLFRFLYNMEFYAKNSNVSGYVNLGYQAYTRVYKRGGLEFSDELNSWLTGFGLSWQVIKPLCLKAGVEMPFFVSATEPMTIEPEFWSLLKIYAGFVYSFDK